MPSFTKAAQSILHFVNLEPGTPVQLIVELVAAVIAAALTLHTLGRLFHVNRGVFGASVLAIVVGGMFTISAGAAVMVFLPELAGRSPTIELVAGCFLLTALLLVVPFIRMMWHCGYFAALAAYFLSAIAGAAAVFAVDGSFDAFSAGSKELNKGVRHNQQMESLLNDK
jgi:hypothetical protein